MLSGMDEYLTYQSVAALLHVAPRTVRSWAATGRLKVVHVGRLVRITPQAIEDFIAAENPV